MNEFAAQHAKDNEACEDKNLRKGRFDDISKELCTLRSISDSFVVSK